MNPQREGSNLKIHITLALQSLGREFKGATKNKSITEMKQMLLDLRREQIGKGIIKSNVAQSV